MPSGIVKQFHDRQAISRLKRKDKDAFVEAYDENVSEINRFIYFKVGNKEEANDLTSAVFLKAWNHIQNKTLVNAKTLRALLYKIARTTIIDYYRSNGGNKSISLDDSANEIDIIDEKISPEKLGEDLDKDNDLEKIRLKLPLLKDEYREAIIMKFINDLSLEEISDVTGKSRGSVRVLVHRSLKALKELIEEE